MVAREDSPEPTGGHSKVSKTGARMSVKELLTLSFSILALVIAGVSTYLNLVLLVDDLSVVIPGEMFRVVRSQDQKLVITDLESAAAFTNAGTRPAAIFSADVIFDQEPEGDCLSGKPGSVVRLRADFEPLIVKEREVVLRRFRVITGINDGTEVLDRNRYSLPVSSEYRSQSIVPLTICLSLVISTGSSETFKTVVRIARVAVSTEGMANEEYEKTKIVLVRRRSTIFDR